MKEPEIDDQTNGNSMHTVRLGKADTFSDKSAAPSTQRQVMTLNALRIFLAGYDCTFRNMVFVCKIIVTIDNLYIVRGEKSEKFI